MKKAFKNFCLVMAAMATSLAFVACNNEDDTKEPANIAGKWAYIEDPTFNELLMININNTTISIGQDSEKAWTNVRGHVTVEGNTVTYSDTDGRSFTGEFNAQDNTLNVTENGKQRTYKRLIDNFSMVGQWKVVKSQAHIKAIKDEITLPMGSVNGDMIPTSMPTSAIGGKFVEWSIERYFGNPEFTDDELKYEVIKEEEVTEMSKEYALANNMLTLTGKVGIVDINNEFMVFQSKDGKQAFLLLTKENVAEMFVGYGLMLSQGNVSEGGIASLYAFRESFMETFENFAIVITLSKQ